MWAARTDDAAAVAARAQAVGLEGHRRRRAIARPGRRHRAVDGTRSSADHGAGTLVPFFIEWDDDYHPAEDAPPGLALDVVHDRDAGSGAPRARSSPRST